MDELGTRVRTALRTDFSAKLSDYWKSCIDEAASDVLGILNIGPAAGIGLIGHFRGWNEAWGYEPILDNFGADPFEVSDAGTMLAYLKGEESAGIAAPRAFQG